MFSLIDASLNRARSMMVMLVFIMIMGSITYTIIPKESSPDITIPIIYVSVDHSGISPIDAERLIVRPLEQELRAIESQRNDLYSAGGERFSYAGVCCRGQFRHRSY